MLPTFLKIKFNRARGFGLLEAVFYVATFAIIASGIVVVLLLILNNYFQFVVNSRLATAGNDVMSTIVRSGQSATSFNLAASVFDQTPGNLSLNSQDPSGESEQISIFLQDEVVWATFNFGTPERLTPRNVRATSLIFDQISNDNTDGFRAEVTLESSRGSYTKAIDLETTVVLRGSYAN